MTPPRGAGDILQQRPQLDPVVECLADRAQTHAQIPPADAAKLGQRVRERAKDLLDEWSKIAKELRDTGTALQYQRETGAARPLLHHFLDPDLKLLPPVFKKFRANRSLRDVEPSVNIWVRTMDNVEVEAEEEET